MSSDSRSLEALGEVYEWEEASDLASICEDKLRVRLKELTFLDVGWPCEPRKIV